MATFFEKTFKPAGDIVVDVLLTFCPYREGHNKYPFSKGAPSFRPYFGGDSDENWDGFWKAHNEERERTEYLQGSIWGDLGQPVRGVVNILKGSGRLLRGLAKLLLPIPIVGFVGLCVWKMWKTEKYLKSEVAFDEGKKQEPSFLLAVKGEGKELLYDLTNGFLLLLRGALQVVFTPFLVFRIPLRLFMTHSSYNPYFKKVKRYDEDKPLDNKLTTSSTVSAKEDVTLSVSEANTPEQKRESAGKSSKKQEYNAFRPIYHVPMKEDWKEGVSQTLSEVNTPEQKAKYVCEMIESKSFPPDQRKRHGATVYITTFEEKYEICIEFESSKKAEDGAGRLSYLKNKYSGVGDKDFITQEGTCFYYGETTIDHIVEVEKKDNDQDLSNVSDLEDSDSEFDSAFNIADYNNDPSSKVLKK